MTLEERLNETISEKDQQIEELQEKIEVLENRFNWERRNWELHSVFEDDAFSRQMPFPRLEMRLTRISEENWYSIEYTYGLVYKHFGDTHTNMLRFIPFSLTTSNGKRGTFEGHIVNGKLDLPFRDGLHIRAESILFNLPAYIICREKGICEKIEVDGHRLTDQLAKMKSVAK